MRATKCYTKAASTTINAHSASLATWGWGWLWKLFKSICCKFGSENFGDAVVVEAKEGVIAFPEMEVLVF